jgi:hypothetical protein
MTPFGNFWSLMLRQQLVISSINLFNVVYTLRFSGEDHSETSYNNLCAFQDH